MRRSRRGGIMEKEYGGCIMEEASWRRLPKGHQGIQGAPGGAEEAPGGTQEQPGGPVEVARRHPRDTQKASKRPPGHPRLQRPPGEREIATTLT